MMKPITFYLRLFDMRLYIDKENIISFMANRDKNIDLFDDSVRLIKKGMEVYYNFPKSEILTNPVLAAWFGRMEGHGVRGTCFFCPEAIIKPERPIKTNFYNNYDFRDRGSIYLLNVEENTYKIIHDKQAILISNPGSEISIFQSLIDIPERTEMMTDICNWKDYIPNVPFSDVILSDTYYFANLKVYEKNDNELIRALASIPKDTFNLVIITKDGTVDERINLETECQKIKDIVVSISGLNRRKCSVTIITSKQTHSRYIITNYYTVTPSSCVHLRDNRLKGDADINIYSHAAPRKSSKNMRLISFFQKVANNSVKIVGDKKSNFISFG